MRPVKQKKRTFASERNKAAANEVDKLIQVGSIHEVLYPDWLANVVMILLLGMSSSASWMHFQDIIKSKCTKEIKRKPHSSPTWGYIVTKFGLKNVGATYQRLVNKMFKQKIRCNVEVYMDDMLVKSAKAHNHVADLEETFQVLRKYQMKLNSIKCAFGISSGKFLGFMVSQRGIEANPEKIQAILTMHSPQNIKEIQTLMGRITTTEETTFNQLKGYLTSPPLLSRTQDGEDPFLYLAASPHGVSAVLIIEEQEMQLPVYYTSRALQGAKLRYPRAEKIAFAMVIAARRLWPYFQAHFIKVLTDQPLRRILHCPETSGRLIQWSIELGEFDIEYKPRIAIKVQMLADFLTEYTYPEPEELLKEEPKPWVLQVDGSTTREASRAGLILTSPKGQCLSYALRFEFKATNNESEYEVLVVGLELAKAVGANHVLAKSDSQLVVGQVLGEYTVKEEVMQKYLDKVKTQVTKLQSFKIVRIPREESIEANYLAKLATAKEDVIPRNTPVRYLGLPSIFAPDVQVQAIDYSNSWTCPIVDYITNGRLPDDKVKARQLKIRAAKYLMMGDVLYRRSFSLPYLRCLTTTESERAMEEVHQGVCGDHQGGRMLAYKLLSLGYYWPSMQKDCNSMVKKCEKCQRFANIIHGSPTVLTPMKGLWPFAQWGVDLIGPLPMAAGQVQHAIIAVDYFTKWVEAKALATITAKFKAYCRSKGIHVHYASKAHPKANGQVEVTNQTIEKGIKERLREAKRAWPDELYNVLWAYRTTPRIATGETPYSLSFGAEAVVPIEIELLNYRTASTDHQENQEDLKAKLDLLEEIRETTMAKIAVYQQRMVKYHEAQVRPRDFRTSDLVLRKVDLTGKKVGKLGPNWEGPYQVLHHVKAGTYRLATLRGKELPNSWNTEHLKKYYK
ncbi:uncharacterized protein LOC131306887 [Rhododendron vialii]|uniref:uncharacterized protein LOC131306887 n=1 Tax=Rhododendron vialii TaxID=182163 RepID=UPI00265FB0D3|nr:uncharacterized protein LOC131306887 [Rhododendron vialii]